MFEEISHYLIFGKPLIVYMGIVTFTILALAAIVGFLVFTRRTNIEFKWHMRLAVLAIIVALIHGFFGMMQYF